MPDERTIRESSLQIRMIPFNDICNPPFLKVFEKRVGVLGREKDFFQKVFLPPQLTATTPFLE